MKKLASIFVLILVPFTNVFAERINGNQVSTPRLCGAMDESSEEKCDNQNTILSNGPTLKAEPFKVKYLLYKNPDNKNEYQEIFFQDKSSIVRANPFPKEKAMWKILVHGFINNDSSQFPRNVKRAYLENLQQNPENLNILVFDWGDGAKADITSVLHQEGIYRHAVENVQTAGEILGDMITYLHNEGFLDIASGLHLVGHSLGAHVSGQAARQIYKNTQQLVWRISGLDPAGPLFWKDAFLGILHDPYPRLHRNRCTFLDVYHTSEFFGSNRKMGDVDFFINGGRTQARAQRPCRHLIEEKRQECSHQFAPEIFAWSINNKTMKACTGCFSYDQYHSGKCNCEDNPILGEYVTEELYNGYPFASGNAYYDIKDDIIGKI